MRSYVYAFHLVIEDDEMFFSFPKFPEIISSIDLTTFNGMSAEKRYDYAADALITALQTCIATKSTIPLGDNPDFIRADGFVVLSIQQAMKLELFNVYRENCRSISDFARKIDKKDTAARRMLDLNHPSSVPEIESAMRSFGKRYIHNWGVQADNSLLHESRPTKSYKSKKSLEPTTV